MPSMPRVSVAAALSIFMSATVAAAPALPVLAADPTASASPPVVQPGEPWIAYQAAAGGGLKDGIHALFVVRPDGTGAHQVVADPSQDILHPDWSRDGTRIAYTTWSEIQVVAADGNHPVVVATCTAPCYQVDWPAWSPDGRTIAFRRLFVEDGTYSGTAIDVVDLETGAVTTRFATVMPDYVEFLRWAPDGQRMVVSLSHYTPGEPMPVNGPLPAWTMTIAVVDLRDGPTAAPFTIPGADPFADYPDWSPIDDRIVFTTYDLGAFNETDQPSNLYTVRPDGSDLKQITFFGRGEDRATEPTWTPDGKRIIFAWVAHDGFRDAQVGYVDPDGRNLTHGLPATDPVYVTHPRLRPTR